MIGSTATVGQVLRLPPENTRACFLCDSRSCLTSYSREIQGEIGGDFGAGFVCVELQQRLGVRYEYFRKF